MAIGSRRVAERDRNGETLRSAAEAGDVEAQRIFGTVLAECLGRDRDTMAAYERIRASRGQAPSERVVAGGAHASPATAQLDAMERKQIERCGHFAPEEIADYHAWLEHAARSGNVEAKVAYADHALREFSGRTPYRVDFKHDPILGNLPEVIRRRDLARTWAEDAVRAGNFEILLVLQNQYDASGALYPRDHVRYWIYDHAADLSLAWQSPWNATGLAELWQSGPERRDDRLTPEQWREVERQARELYLRYYGEAPDGGG